MNSEYGFVLTHQKWSSPLGLYFKHSTNGTESKERTEVKLMFDDRFFHIDFACYDDPFLNQNTMTVHNDPLYNQEVFELFISDGDDDPAHYLEVEINPNNALWTGKIHNPTLGDGGGNSTVMIDYKDSGIQHAVQKSENSWSGRLSVPWKLISDKQASVYRVNFYRIVSKVSHPNPDWHCNKKECHFLCWSPTMSGENPAFHKPRKFGKMVLKK